MQAPLREAVGPEEGPVLIKISFSSFDLETWKTVAKSCLIKLLIKQHNPDWNDIQLLLDCMTETEKQLILKMAQDLAIDPLSSTGEYIKDHFPLQDPQWDPNR